jgi:hypothetical protein
MKIAFLLSGNARTSPFNIEPDCRNLDILKSYNQYIFTDQLKALVEYKVYISTDDIHLQDTLNYFSRDCIGNIHLLATDYYLNPVQSQTTKVDTYLQSYHNQTFQNHEIYDNSIHQHYKILDCYNLLRQDHEAEDFTYIVRLRLDVIIDTDIFDILHRFTQHPKLQIVIKWDLFALGKPDIMKIYSTGLDHDYGKYTNQVVIPDRLPIMRDYKSLDYQRWMYAPERQLFEMLFEFCNDRKIDINESIYEHSFCTILR